MQQAINISFNPQLISGFISGLKPEPRLTVTQWAEKNRILNSKASAEGGPYRISRTPYWQEISDDLSAHSTVQEIIVMKGIQLGFTEIGINWIGYTIDVSPGPMMAVMPTLDTMKRNVKLRIDPMLEDTPSLKTKVGGKRSKDGGNTMFQKDFPGGALVLTGANSAAGLRSMPVKKLFLDEVDGYPGDVDGEGDPISLAEKRQATFGTRKKRLKGSTPTIKGLSKIENEFLQTDQRYLYVPCPHCKKKQTLIFGQLRWEPGKYSLETVHYECIECKGKIYERHKTWMFSNYEWVITKPENARPEKKGYHINSLYSPDGWLAWWEICKEWDEAATDENKRKTLINTILAETYEQESEAPQWEMLYERAQSKGFDTNKPTSSVAFITAGVDVQADRLEVEIVGWQKGRISQQLDYRVLMGDVDKDEVWNQLTDILNEIFIREDGAALPIRVMCIDTGYKPGRVDDFAKIHGTQRVIPIKGTDSLQMPFSAPRVTRKTKAGKNVGKLKVWHVGVSYLKGQLYGWLRKSVNHETGEIPNGYCHFTRQDTHYFRGLTAEALQPVRNNKNHIVYQWIKKYERNEPLDIRVYNMAGAYMIGFDRWTDARWERERSNVPVYDKKEVNEQPIKKVKKKKPPPSSSYWG